MSILNQNLLTLDFWQDQVTYVGRTVPTGTIGSAAINITDEQINVSVFPKGSDMNRKELSQNHWKHYGYEFSNFCTKVRCSIFVVLI